MSVNNWSDISCHLIFVDKKILIHVYPGMPTIFFSSKTIPKSRSVVKDGSRFLGLFRKGKTGIIAKFHRTDIVICNHSREG